MVQAAESSFAKKDLVVSLGNGLNTTRWCTLAAKKANHIVGCISKRIAIRLRKVILPLYLALLRLHLKTYVWFGTPQYKKDVSILGQVEEKAIKMVMGM